MNSTLIAASLFAQQKAGDDAGGMACAGACGLMFLLPLAIISIVMIAMFWKVFTKAGQPGWASLVPIYNTYILVVEIAKKDMVWFLLSLFVPFAVVVPLMDLAEKFGKDRSFGIGLLLLPPVFFGILAFGSAKYQGGRGGAKKKSYDDDDEEEDEDDDAPPRKKKTRDYDDE